MIPPSGEERSRPISYDTVFFDCDSTLSAVEGIDELARWVGVYDQISCLTQAAMDGELSLDEVYGKRLELIKPDRGLIDQLGELYIAGLVDGAAELIAKLQASHKAVHIVSGGLYQAVAVLGRKLGLPGSRIHAVKLEFDLEGRYLGFDRRSPLSRNGGKTIVCRRLIRPGSHAVLIGDGMTDLEVREAGITFIGFGGVVTREAVKAQAETFIDSASLEPLLPLLLGPDEIARP